MKLAWRHTFTAAAMAAFAAAPALAQTALIKAPDAAHQADMVNKGDTAWMLVSSALVLMMSVPALALFYGGLVRTKNMLSVLMQVFMIVSVAGAGLVLLGLFDGLHRRTASPSLLRRPRQGVPARASPPRPTPRPSRTTSIIPEYVYVIFQMTFALHHAGADRRRLRGAHEILRADGVHGRCG